MTAWIIWFVLVIIALIFVADRSLKSLRKYFKINEGSLREEKLENILGMMYCVIILVVGFGPTFLIEFPRVSAIVSGNHLQVGVPVSFENGTVTPHLWGTWNPSWNRRVLELPQEGLNMLSFAPSQKGATYQARNRNVGWVTSSFNINVRINDYKTFFSLPERQNVYWDDKALRGRIISDFLDIVEERRDEHVAWASNLSTEEVRLLEVRSEVPAIAKELVRRLGPLADGLDIKVTNTVLGPFREF